MTSKKAGSERRKLKRFQVQIGAFVILRPSDTGVGRLIDISTDGLTLEYISTQEPKIQPTRLEIFVADSPFRLYEVPCETITDLVTNETDEGSLSKRRRGIKFGKLSPSQSAQLEYFILHHTQAEI